MASGDRRFAFQRGGDDLDRLWIVDAHRARGGVRAGNARSRGSAETAGEWQALLDRDEWIAVVAMRAQERDGGDDRGVELRIARHELGVASGDRFDRGRTIA